MNRTLRFLLITLAFSAGGLFVLEVLSRLSADAIGMMIGLLFGILAGVPIMLLFLATTAPRPRPRQQPRRAVRVIDVPQQPTAQRALLIDPLPDVYAPDVQPPGRQERHFKVVGEREEWIDEW